MISSTTKENRSNTKARTQVNANRAFTRYLTTRRAYKGGRATIQQVARALALFDLTLAVANLPPAKQPGAKK